MPVVRPCSKPGCATLTMGARCLVHELEHAELRPARSRNVASAAVVAAIAGFAAAFLARTRLSL